MGLISGKIPKHVDVDASFMHIVVQDQILSLQYVLFE
jgi:hypothetical protein